MEKITVDLTGIKTRSEIHDVLTKALSLPEYYGRNLDALYDCTSEIFAGRRIELTLVGFDTLPEEFVKYGKTIVSIFERVSSEMVVIEDDSILIVKREG